MLSTIPAFQASDGFFGTQTPALDAGSPPWECPDIFFDIQELSFPTYELQEPVLSNSGSDPDTLNSKPASPGSGSDEPNQTMNSSSPGSDITNRSGPVPDERKLRRMKSNRESAKRSRMRKQKHLEKLRNDLNRLRMGNRELTNRLRILNHYSEIVRRDNGRLQSESTVLRQRLWDIRQVLLIRELRQISPSPWQFNNYNATPTFNPIINQLNPLS